jgi:hypothetical protein
MNARHAQPINLQRLCGIDLHQRCFMIGEGIGVVALGRFVEGSEAASVLGASKSLIVSYFNQKALPSLAEFT